MSKTESIKQFSIKELLSDNANYLIPMYQRNYAWEEREINQLIQDVVDYQQKNDAKQPYYIGTLVVFQREDGSFEVIDGQQRFTTLSLVAICLKNLLADPAPAYMNWYEKFNIEFESRPNSKKTFKALFDKKPKENSKGKLNLEDFNGEDFNDGIIKGYKLIEKALLNLKELNQTNVDISLNDLAEYLLNQVQIMRVAVPQDTDLNHYFEIMNNRGEQLEKHEVLKARMMAVLEKDDTANKENNINALNTVWNACSNMERYVQYGFTPDERKTVFGDNWGSLKVKDFDALVTELNFRNGSANMGEKPSKFKLADILDIPNGNNIGKTTTKPKKDENGDAPDRFGSVINFSNFLLHVLRIQLKIDIPLDDKRLIEQFDKHVFDVTNQIYSVKSFIYALLKCKFLFDQYVIKRDLSKGDDSWSLKRLKCEQVEKGGKSEKVNSASFVNSFDDKENGNWNSDQILMLQSAFHVSAPTLVYKHWLNAALFHLYSKDVGDGSAFIIYLEKLANMFVFDRFLVDKESEKSYFDMIYGSSSADTTTSMSDQQIAPKLRYSEIRNNLVFNYLDYLLWREGKDNKENKDQVISNFKFTFRSSVEHFFPQTPLKDITPLENKDSLHEFGNLCLISHSKNSRVGNLSPKAKLGHFEGGLNRKNIDSLKLYEMIKILNASQKIDNPWGTTEIQMHGAAMIKVLLDERNRIGTIKTGSN